MNITAQEMKMITQIAESDYHEELTKPTWLFEACEGFGDAAGGIMASLVKKGLAGTTGSQKNRNPEDCLDDNGECWLTEAGARVYQNFKKD